MPNAEPIPYTAPLLEGRDELISRPWYQWLYGRGEQIGRTPEGIGAVALPPTSAAAVSPSVLVVTPTVGVYRVSWYLRVTNAAATSSSLAVTIGWVESGLALTATGAAVTGNTITTVQSQTVLLKVDGAVPITYAVAYTSVPAGMRYRLELICEQVAS